MIAVWGVMSVYVVRFNQVKGSVNISAFLIGITVASSLFCGFKLLAEKSLRNVVHPMLVAYRVS